MIHAMRASRAAKPRFRSASVSDFRGRVAVVTGAASGIGRALAYQLAAEGALLALSDVDDEGLTATVAQVRSLGAAVRSDQLDVVDRAAVLAYADAIAEQFGAVHLVINNAGVLHVGAVSDMQLSEVERVLDVNFWGVVNGTMAFLPHLIASGQGHLVNMSSLFGLVPIPTQSAYVASKYAVRGFTESLNIEMRVAGHPVRVTCVHPGGVKTAIAVSATRNARPHASRAPQRFGRQVPRMPADKAAAVILRGVAQGRPRVLVGTDAWAVHLLSSLSNRGWQALVASGYRHFSVRR